MSATAVYMDTSALAKWYLNETNSEVFSKYIRSVDIAVISSLTKVEMRSLLARKKRTKEISSTIENRVYTALLSDISCGHLSLYPIVDAYFERAVHLIGGSKFSLRSLDALHLVCAQDIGCKTIATADTVVITAALQLGFEVARFDT